MCCESGVGEVIWEDKDKMSRGAVKLDTECTRAASSIATKQEDNEGARLRGEV